MQEPDSLGVIFTDVKDMGYRGFPACRDTPCGLCGEMILAGADGCGVDNLLCHFHCAEASI
jgi:hypothetical protein